MASVASNSGQPCCSCLEMAGTPLGRRASLVSKPPLAGAGDHSSSGRNGKLQRILRSDWRGVCFRGGFYFPGILTIDADFLHPVHHKFSYVLALTRAKVVPVGFSSREAE
jgi:hypothetical protein